MFHVERHPVQIAPTPFRPTTHQTVDLRIDNLQRQSFGERRRSETGLTINTDFQTVAAVPNSDTPLPGTVLRLSKQREGFLTVPNQRLRRRAPERFSAPQIRQRLEQAGLARGIGPIDQIKITIGFELDLFEAAKVLRPKQLDRHDREAATTGASA